MKLELIISVITENLEFKLLNVVIKYDLRLFT